MKKLLMQGCVVLSMAALSCAAPEGEGLAKTPAGTGATVMFDAFAKPLPNIPLPNDFATRLDPGSPTGRRINASMEASTEWEKATRRSIDALDGWGTYQSITVAFERPLDVPNLIKRHQGDDYDTSDDAVLLLDINPDSPDFCSAQPLDMGEGNFPITLERQEYYPNDTHNTGDQLSFEDREEDLNRNNKLDPGEDIDMDGVLDHPNLPFPGASRFSIMNFYERETNTLIMKPVMPLREKNTYAVVLTRRLIDEDGRSVRSPFDYINHTTQTKQLEPLVQCLPKFGLSKSDIAFTWAYSTQSITDDFKVIRDGLYGQGVLKRLATEYPGEIKELFALRDGTPGSNLNLRIVPGDQFRGAAVDLLKALTGTQELTPSMQQVLESHKFIDYHVVFSFDSPQFFPRCEGINEGEPNRPAATPCKENEKLLPLYKQIFNVDSVTGAANVRPEQIVAWITVPKNRGGKPAPAVILGHGYTGAKYDPLLYGGFFARYGMASIGMENVSHGIPLGQTDLALASGLLGSKGLIGMYKAVIEKHRAFDQNGDGIPDSGADFWTSYIFHTRDVVRQTAVDYFQLVRLLRGFDGVKTWKYPSQTKREGLAGDFDGDGVIDIGGSAPIHMTGGSLGGIMSGVMSGAEPQLDVAIPVSGGGGLPDIGVRSIQGGVGEAVNLRMMGPLLLTLKNSAGTMDLWQYLPNLNGLGKLNLGPVTATLKEGDTAVVTNLKSGEHRCARVQAGGLLRVGVSSDQGDRLKLDVYDGALPPEARTGCSVAEGLKAYWSADTVAVDFKFQGVEHKAGEPIIALGDGFGLRRQSPELRRFMGLAQLSIDKGDPINWVPYASRWNLTYGTGERVGTRMLVLNTVGDMNVPVATGTAMARAAGFIELREKDPRYGKTPNRVLIDNGVIEAVERVGRYKNSMGQNVHMDVENFASMSSANDQFDVPRLNPPLRLVRRDQKVGGVTGVLFPMVVPTGKHGFDGPDPSKPFDLGQVMMNMLGRYGQLGGSELPFEACMEKSTCSWVPPIPAQ